MKSSTTLLSRKEPAYCIAHKDIAPYVLLAATDCILCARPFIPNYVNLCVILEITWRGEVPNYRYHKNKN